MKTPWTKHLGPLAALLAALGTFTPPAASASPPDPREGIPDVRGSLPTAVPGTGRVRPMASEGIQSIEADSLHEYDVTHYRFDLNFPCIGSQLSGACTITLKSRQSPLTTVGLNFVTLNADTVQQNGTAAPYSVLSGMLNVTLPVPVPFGDSTVLRIVYHGPTTRGYYSASPETWFTFTEPSDARYWFPCYDQPYDKATAEMHATVPDTMFVASNGIQTAPPVTNVVTHKKTYHWGTNYPLSTYLISVAIGHYVELRDSANYVPLRSYVLKADSVKAAYDFFRVPAMVNYFGQLWGQYPFEKYGMAATKNFGGGMEHQTMTTISRTWITGDRKYEWAIAHELGHQYWGDMVTCLSWPDIWVNEGFASYADILFGEHTYGLDSMRVRMAAWAKSYMTEDSVTSYAIYNPPSNFVFGTAVYNKGAWVLHMLRHVMGDSAFVRGWRDYGNLHKYGNGTCRDFQAAQEVQYGGSLAWFFDKWIFDRGYPVYRKSKNYVPRAGGGYDNYVTLQQVQTGGVPLYDMPVDLKLHTASGDSLVTVRDKDATQVFHFAMSSPLDSVTIDPGRWLLYKLAAPGSIVAAPEAGAAGRLRIASVHAGRGAVDMEIEVPATLRAAGAKLQLYDLTGRLIATPWQGREPGLHRVRWNGQIASGAIAASGVYFARLSGEGETSNRKLFWIR